MSFGRSIKLLTKFGSMALRPTFENGRWWPPLVSLKKAKLMRNDAIMNGSYGSFSSENGGWDPSWDQYVSLPRKMFSLRPYKVRLFAFLYQFFAFLHILFLFFFFRF